MKVLYIGGFELPDKNAAAFRVRANASIISKLGCKVLFRGLSKDHTIFKEPQNIDDSRYIERIYPISLVDWIRYFFVIDDIIEILDKEKFNLIICYNFPAFATIKLVKYANKNGARVINECTEWYSSRGMGVFKGFMKKVDTLLRIFIVPKFVSYNIVTTNYLAHRFKRNSIIVPEIYTHQYKYEYNSQKSERIKLIYMGSPGKKVNKDNLGMMINLLSGVSFAKFDFIIVGLTEDEFLQHYCIDFDSYKKISCRVKFLGRLRHEECINLLKLADYTFIYRDKTRLSSAGFPRKVSESLQYSVPVITTRTSDLANYIENGKTGYLIDFDRATATLELEKIFSLGKRHSDLLKEEIYLRKPLESEKFTRSFKKMLNLIMK